MFFITFMVICTFVMLNLFIFVILSEFSKYSSEDENPTQLFKDQLVGFHKTWSSLTRSSKGIHLPSKLLIDFFKILEKPLGFGKECRRELVAREIMKMNLIGYFFRKFWVFFNFILKRWWRQRIFQWIALFLLKAYLRFEDLRERFPRLRPAPREGRLRNYATAWKNEE